MIPTRIAVKNFLTFGEAPGGGPVEFLFPDGEPLWVLCGANGSGKSAVFDAITYALYGQHRGSRQQARQKDAQLVRHGANGFEVEVEFVFAGTKYRIRHTRPRKGRTTQHLQINTADGWVGALGGDPAGATTAADIERWVTETLGLGYEAFTNSVLLKQGEADKLFTAGRDDRIAVLKGIIGFNKYEALSGRVGSAAKAQADGAKLLLTQRDAIPDATDAETTSAAVALRVAVEARATAQAALSAANERVTTARQWEALDRECGELAQKISAAEERHKAGRQIRADMEAFIDLTAGVPALESLFVLRGRLAALDDALRAAVEDATTKAAARDAARSRAEAERLTSAGHRDEAAAQKAMAERLAAEVKHGQSLLKEVEAVATLDEHLRGYPVDLDSRAVAAVAAEREAAAIAERTTADWTRADTLLAEARKQEARFAGVAVGVPCPHCRQPVDDAHAVSVRAELLDAMEAARREVAAASAVADESAARLAVARDACEAVRQKKDARDKLVEKRSGKVESLQSFGVTGDAAALRTELAAKEERRRDAVGRAEIEAEAGKVATAEAARLDAAHDALDREVKAAESARARNESDRATTLGQEQATLSHLPRAWTCRLPSIDAATVHRLAAERDRLQTSGVAERFRELEQDETRRAEWEARRDDVGTAIGRIPAAGRVTEAAAKAHQARTEADARSAAKAAFDAENAHVRLVEDKTRRDAMTAEHRAAAERHRLLDKLDNLLGETGLQRELGCVDSCFLRFSGGFEGGRRQNGFRRPPRCKNHLKRCGTHCPHDLVLDAEEQIVAFANETLYHLSDGDLALEEETAPESAKTFDLRVRRGGGEPIGVAFLSGSQRFRVAVSVALAVGRFASGRARPLEAVIIDEGFGSLDPLGLRAMAAELKRLQQTGEPKRIILVSHQPDFTDQFAVGYKLEPGEAGTTATAFRR